MINAIIKIQSETRRHGARTVKERRSGNSAAVAKALKNFRTEGISSKGDDPLSRKVLPLDHVPKEYGSHDGQKHSAILGRFSFSKYTDASDQFDRVNLAMSIFESQQSIDLQAKKSEYRSRRDTITKELRQIHGVNLDTKGLADYQNRCAAAAFNYVASQIVMILYSTEKFPGATLDEQRNLYVAAYPCKSLYTDALLTKGFVNSLINVMKTGTKPDNIVIKHSKVFGATMQISSKGLTRYKADSPVLARMKSSQRRSVDKEGWTSFDQ